MCGVRSVGLCPACVELLEPPPTGPPIAGIDRLVALTSYDSAGRDLVHGWKYGGDDSAVSIVAQALVRALGPEIVSGTVATWAPTTARRRRERGFDQARGLAMAVSMAGGFDLIPLLARSPQLPQTGLSLTQRLASPNFRPVSRSPRSVLLVDDVVTTGSTLHAASEALRSAGATRVVAAVVARTPRRLGPV